MCSGFRRSSRALICPSNTRCTGQSLAMSDVPLKPQNQTSSCLYRSIPFTAAYGRICHVSSAGISVHLSCPALKPNWYMIMIDISKLVVTCCHFVIRFPWFSFEDATWAYTIWHINIVCFKDHSLRRLGQVSCIGWVVAYIKQTSGPSIHALPQPSNVNPLPGLLLSSLQVALADLAGLPLKAASSVLALQ